jgi:ribonuclease PH
MAREETAVVNPYRVDARAADAMRPVRIEPHPLRHPEGSALIEVGETRVLCTATVESGVPHFLRNDPKKMGTGWVTAEYAMIPRATRARTPRERGSSGARSSEISRLVGRSLRAVCDLGALGQRTVTVDCDVLQADGGTRAASVTGGFVALALAMEKLRLDERIVEWPLRHFAAAVSVGFVDGSVLLDLDYSEDSRAQLDVNVVKTQRMEIIEVQGTAETEPVPEETFRAMLALADRGIRNLVECQRQALPGVPCPA